MSTDPIVAAQAREIHDLKAENAELRRQLQAIRYEIKGAVRAPNIRRPFDLSVTDHRICRLLALHGQITHEMTSAILTGYGNHLSTRISRLRKRIPSEVKIVAVDNVGYHVTEGLDILRKAYNIEQKDAEL